jgi:hypothetical protein
MRQLKYHEKKLLKKVDFTKWKKEHNLREAQVRQDHRASLNIFQTWVSTQTAHCCQSILIDSSTSTCLISTQIVPHTKAVVVWHLNLSNQFATVSLGAFSLLLPSSAARPQEAKFLEDA